MALPDSFILALREIKTDEQLRAAWRAMRERDRLIRQRAGLRNAETLYPGAFVSFGDAFKRGKRSLKIGKLIKINRTTASVMVPDPTPWAERMAPWRVSLSILRLANATEIGRYRKNLESVQKHAKRGELHSGKRRPMMETPPED